MKNANGKKSVPLLFSQMLNFFCFTYCMSFIHVTNKFLPVRPIYMSVIQVTQPVGYVGTLPAICINEKTAEWTARDCYVSLLGGGTVCMSTCESTAEWTIRDCRYEYVLEHSRV